MVLTVAMLLVDATMLICKELMQCSRLIAKGSLTFIPITNNRGDTYVIITYQAMGGLGVNRS